MINAVTHELIQDNVEYMVWLDEKTKQAYRDFMDYARQLDDQRRYIKKLETDFEHRFPASIQTQKDSLHLHPGE